MSAYFIVDVHVKDAETYATYRDQVPATIEKYGGTFLVRGGKHETLEGEWQPQRVVVIEFADMAALKRWYNSPEYQPLLKLRQSASTASGVAVEGA